MKKLFLTLIIILILILFTTPLWADTHTVTDCTYANVQAAVTAASDGDIVHLNCATGLWATNVSITGKGITLMGNGKNSTTIDGALRIDLDCATNSLMRVTGIHFNLVSGAVGFYNSEIAFMYCTTQACTPMKGKCETQNKLRIDNNKFTFGTATDHAILSMDFEPEDMPMGGHIYGLMDNNTFVTTDTAGTKTALFLSANPKWTGDLNYGTWKKLYIEDNTFDYSGVTAGLGQNCATDYYCGSNIVTRYNTFTNSKTCDHGADSLHGSNQIFEVYKNAFSSTKAEGISGTVGVRGGTGLIYDNTFTSVAPGYYSNGDRITFQYYRTDQDGSPCGGYTCVYGQCDHTHPPDGTWERDNEDDATGWRCLQQPGVNWNTSTTRWVTAPIYHWNNLYDGSPIVLTSIYWPTPAHLVANRDYYTYTTIFDGTAGTGRGTLASRPTSCTENVAYWATDTNTLYTCTVTGNPGTWTFYYTPYQYPHPLRGEGPSVYNESITLGGSSIASLGESTFSAPRNLRLL